MSWSRNGLWACWRILFASSEEMRRGHLGQPGESNSGWVVTLVMEGAARDELRLQERDCTGQVITHQPLRKAPVMESESSALRGLEVGRRGCLQPAIPTAQCS